ncbi:LTA synthase family protein [Cytophagaceae bacterium ABcell3]|nr:LTA synthase family protein [Cytophagaceae bacterium ABcell3]
MNKNLLYKIIGSYVFLLFVLLLIRGKVMQLSYFSFFTSPRSAPYILAAAWYDWLFISAITLFFLLLGYVWIHKVKRLKMLGYTYNGLAVLVILAALVNVVNVHMLGTPFNYQWLYYSDFLGNSDSKQAIMANVNLWLILEILCFSGLVISGGWLLKWAIDKWAISNLKLRSVTYVSILLLFTYFIGARYFIEQKGLKYNQTANPIVAFTESAIHTMYFDQPDLYNMELPDDFEPFPKPEINHKANLDPKASQIKNVLLYVLESVPAEYVAGYDREYEVTPNIEKHLKHALVFSDIYAHTPTTNNSLVSILGSIYPLISYKTLTVEYPDIKWPTISSELKSHGFQTSFFHASDNRFQKMDEYLSHRKFDLIKDYQNIPCDGEVMVGSTKEWKYLDGVDEECMADAFINWLDDVDAPFFSTIWTMQTHYPYFASGPEKDYIGDENPELNRYLNALNHSDAVFGKVLGALKQRDLMDSTLVIILGDHGEAFGRHGQVGHAVYVYEENVRIPLIFINPVLYNENVKEVVGGQVDLAPTIMDVLNLPTPSEWQGGSLFNTKRANRAYFFNPRSNYLFGYRTPEYKFIYDATENKSMVFDLAKDPKEAHNIADSLPDFVDTSHKRLARWVQYHSSVMKEVLNEK